MSHIPLIYSGRMANTVVADKAKLSKNANKATNCFGPLSHHCDVSGHQQLIAMIKITQHQKVVKCVILFYKAAVFYIRTNKILSQVVQISARKQEDQKTHENSS